MKSINFDTNADDVTDFGQSSWTLLNANGAEVTTQRDTIGSAAKIWSKTVTTTAANGWSKTSSIYLNGDASADETESDNTVLNGDGSTTETDEVTYAATGAVKSDTVTTVSANGLNTTVTIYLGGTAASNMVEEKILFTTADGIENQFNKYYTNGALTCFTATGDVPDLSYTTTTFSDNSEAETDYIPNRNGSYNWIYSAPSGALIDGAIHTIDANNVDTWDYATYNSNGTITKETVVNLDVATENKFEAIAARLYDTMVDRDMTSIEVQSLIAYISNDNLNTTGLANALMSSSEFSEKYGSLSDAEFIDRIYENALNRAPSLADFESDLDQLDTGTLTRAAFAIKISESSEHVVDGNTHAITNNTYIGTTDYALDHTTDVVVADGMVTRLFETGLNRDPTASELSGYADDILAGRVTEATLANYLVRTSEFISKFGSASNVDAMIVPFYLEALGRDPTSQELTSLMKAANDGDLTTADLMVALAESPEHFLYGDHPAAYQSVATAGVTVAGSNRLATFQSGASSGTVSGSGDGVAVLGTSSIAVTGSNDSIYLDGSGDVVKASAASILAAAYQNDTFILDPGFGRSTLNGFATGAGTTDVIEFSKTEFANFAAVQAAMSMSGAGTVITHGSDVLTLTKIAQGSLTSAQFRFV